ncbi:hypothetical protein STEG23_002204, partial [Scotinomys teguina]
MPTFLQSTHGAGDKDVFQSFDDENFQIFWKILCRYGHPRRSIGEIRFVDVHNAYDQANH